MNDFENSLRDSLQRAVPAAPEEPNRSEGARAYAASARRRRTGVLAVGAAAVVVAAIVVVPSVVERSDRGIAPAVGPPQTQAPKQTGELPDQPFECPSRGGPDQSMDTPPDGTIDPGAVLVRVCAAQEGTPWIPPLDALTSDVESITQAFNGLAVAEDRMPCTEEFGPAYLMVFQYPDGHAVQVRGDLYGCRLVSFGALERQGADEALSAYFDALQAQRVKTGPILDGEPLSCPDPSFSSVDTLMPVTLEDPGLTRVTVCRYSTDGALIRQGRAQRGRGVRCQCRPGVEHHHVE